MKTHICEGCKHELPTGKGLTLHHKSCGAWKRYTAEKRKGRMNSATSASTPAVFAAPSMDISPVDHASEPEEIDTSNNLPSLEQYRPSGLPNRRIRLPKRFQDLLPAPPPIILTPEEPLAVSSPTPSSPSFDTYPRQYQSEKNSYGVYRVYDFGAPTFTPDCSESASPSTSAKWNTPFGGIFSDGDKELLTSTNHPFSNKSVFLLMKWHYEGTTKTMENLNKLVYNVLLNPNFLVDDLSNFNASREFRRMDNFKPLNDGWVKSQLSIPLPCANHSFPSEEDAPVFTISNVYHRNLLDLVKAAFQEPAAAGFNISPFEEYWQPKPDQPPERIYSELYNSDKYLEEQRKLQRQFMDSELEVVIAPIMVWSDSTHLATFGTASLWPIYISFGSLSKYMRSKPTMFASHHLAYIPKLDDTIHDVYKESFGCAPSREMLSHLKRELVHALWFQILDKKFMDAYTDGIEMMFTNGIKRRVFPKFFIYAADYPEKVLLTCLKYLGKNPCTRCEIPKAMIPKIGSKSDMKLRERLSRVDNEATRDAVNKARALIFKKGVSITSKRISAILGPSKPTRNAFAEKLGPHGVNFYDLYTVDLLHEFELGVFKAVFMHIIRILHSKGRDTVQTLNERDTIRKFSNNVSEMKQLAARDFEDLLQCAIPAFDGLLDKKNSTILSDLLFELGHWHALAKLRLHTESTLDDLTSSGTRLGVALRKFQNITCQDFITRELPTEVAARGCRQASSAKTKNISSKGKSDEKDLFPRVKVFSMETPKLHVLQDYPQQIKKYGTTDGISTQIGELEHQRCKRFFEIVNKGKIQFTPGIGNHVWRECLLHNTAEASGTLYDHSSAKRVKKAKSENPSMCIAETETLPSTDLRCHYQMSHEMKHRISISRFLRENEGDPALKDFHPHLKDHLLRRTLKMDYEGDETPFSDADRASISIVKHELYFHKVLRINYTTYDCRREQDSLNPSTHGDIMVLAREDIDGGHPYWYGKIVLMFHVVVLHRGHPDPILMDVLLVRWYGLELKHKFGWKARRLPKIGFIEDDVDGSFAFGFLDPLDVLRAAHIIPCFREGHTNVRLGPSIVRSPEENDEDYNLYYVNIFPDRDMMMRYRGGGVGHESTRNVANAFSQGNENEPVADEDEFAEDAMDTFDNEDDVDELEDEFVDEELDYGYTLSDDLDDQGIDFDDIMDETTYTATF